MIRYHRVVVEFLSDVVAQMEKDRQRGYLAAEGEIKIEECTTEEFFSLGFVDWRLVVLVKYRVNT